MSDTDKTRPDWVKMVERPDVFCVPHHDHRTDSCTLPPFPTRESELGWQASGCYWAESRAFWDEPENRCGCPMCSMQFTRRGERRRSRHHARLEAQLALKAARADMDAALDF